MDTEFEWDDDKARSNEQKHGITFEEASTVFGDPLAVIFDDPEHSDEEPREIVVGYSNHSRLLIVSFTHREPAVRIVSARRATPRERDKHERSLFGGSDP